MSNLGPQRINQSFGDLLQLPNGLTPASQNVQDGAGNVSPLEISTTAVDLPIVGPDGSGMLSDLGGASGSNFIGFEQDGTGAVLRTSQDKMREMVSVLDFGADPTGVTDSATDFLRAFTQAQSAGIGVDVPSGTYNISNSSSFPDQSNSITPVNVDSSASTVITGATLPASWGDIPCFGHTKGNTYNLIQYNYKYAAPNLAIQDPGAPGTYPFGVATEISEMVPGTSFRGNANASFKQVIGNSGVNAQIGAVNMVTRLESGFLGDGNGTEIDIDNYAVDRKGLGIVVTGVGNKQTESGIKITRGDTLSNWYYGIQVYRAKYGLYVDLTDESAPINGVYITGMSKDLLKLTPKDDLNPTDAMTYGTNAAGSNVIWRINKNGSSSWQGYVKSTGDAVADTSNLGVQIGTASSVIGVSAVAAIVGDAGAYGGYNDLIIQPRTGSGSVGDIRFYGGAASPTEQWRVQANNSFRPGADNIYSLGAASYRASVVYAGTGTINTSDEREKQQWSSDLSPEIRAWAKVEYGKFKFTDAIEKKGDGARWHVGLIAQRVKEAFESEGLDAFTYGLLCYDAWDAETDAEGNEIKPAGNRYGIRYEEALALECAYLRSQLTGK